MMRGILITKFSYKICCNLRLQSYLISFYMKWILTKQSLDYIFFSYILHVCKIFTKLVVEAITYVVTKFCLYFN